MGTDIHLRVERLTGDAWKLVPVPIGAIDHTWELEQLEYYEMENANSSMAQFYRDKIANCWYDRRNYMLFAVLANVRNGYGVAGVRTHDPVVPIAEPRGLPEDRDRTGESDDDGWCYGDHSYSWLTVEELLSYDWEHRTPMVGVFDRVVYESEEFQAWDRKKAPTVTYCGGVAGRNVVNVSEGEIAGSPNWTHVSLSWEEACADHCSDFRQIIPVLCEIGRPDEVRIVFGFDS